MTTNPLHQDREKNKIFAVAVMRFGDKTVCAYFAYNDVDKEGVREQVASNPSAKAGRLKTIKIFRLNKYFYYRRQIYCVRRESKHSLLFGLAESSVRPGH